ncbi:MAG: hypothetical protein AMXMBFR46_28190 [Acidimicrobiia bacterium]
MLPEVVPLVLELSGVDEDASVSEELRPVGDGLCSVEVELLLAGDVLEKVESVELLWPLVLEPETLPVPVEATDDPEVEGDEDWFCCDQVWFCIRDWSVLAVELVPVVSLVVPEIEPLVEPETLPLVDAALDVVSVLEVVPVATFVEGVVLVC